METGHVVEFIDRQKIMCAVVLEVKKERLRVLTENNREVKLSAARLAHRSRTRLDPAASRTRLIDALRAVSARRRTLAAGIDIEALWEVLHDEPEWIDLPTMAALCFSPPVDDDQEAAVGRAFFENRGFFRYDHTRFFPISPAERQRRLAKEAEAARREAVVQAGADWLARLKAADGPVSPPSVDGDVDLAAMARDYVIFGRDGDHAPLVREMLSRTGGGDEAGLFDLLVRAGVFDRDENLDLYRFGVETDFASEPLAAAEGRPAGGDREDARREDLTHLHLLTIDGQGTQDFDDALSLEPLADGWRLGVHIADVAQRVGRDGPIDRAALRRGSSIYMPDAKIPMLPPILAEDGCSLRADMLRPAVSVLLTLDGTLAVRDRRLVASRIRVGEQMTYADANFEADRREDLTQLRRIARHFRQQRLDAGAVHISVPEVAVWCNGRGEVRVQRIDREDPAHLIVSELMIMANAAMAGALAEWGLPAVFRGQPAPRERLYAAGEGTLFQHHMQRKHLSRLVLAHTPQPHAGLGLKAYVTATSPIRKYVDLLTQRQLRAGLGLETPYTAEQIDRVLQALELPLSHVAAIQRNRQRYWLLRHLARHVGEKHEAIVLQRRRSNCLILIPAYMLECELPLSGGMTLHPEDVVQVTLQHVDPRRDLLRVFLG